MHVFSHQNELLYTRLALLPRGVMKSVLLNEQVLEKRKKEKQFCKLVVVVKETQASGPGRGPPLGHSDGALGFPFLQAARETQATLPSTGVCR